MLVLVLLAMVVVLDQATKWWAWRHVTGTQINSGGDIFVGSVIGTWYNGRVTGALLDLLDFSLLSLAVTVLSRRRVPALVSVPGALMIGGWGSNLLDRLGMHYWTAPGSARGAVDFIHVGNYFYNVADIFIMGCTPLFVLAAGYQAVRVARRRRAAGRVPLPAGRRLLALLRVPALASAGLTLVVALGAANYGGVHVSPRRPPAPAATHTHETFRPLTDRRGSPAPPTSPRR